MHTHNSICDVHLSDECPLTGQKITLSHNASVPINAATLANFRALVWYWFVECLCNVMTA